MVALVQQSENALAFLSQVAEKSCEDCPVWGVIPINELGRFWTAPFSFVPALIPHSMSNAPNWLSDGNYKPAVKPPNFDSPGDVEVRGDASGIANRKIHFLVLISKLSPLTPNLQTFVTHELSWGNRSAGCA